MWQNHAKIALKDLMIEGAGKAISHIIARDQFNSGQ